MHGLRGLHALGRGCAAADDEPGRHGDGALDVLVLQPEDHLVGEQVLLAHELGSDSLGRSADLDARCGSAVEAGQAEIALTSWKITRSCRDLKGRQNGAAPAGRVRISENARSPLRGLQKPVLNHHHGPTDPLRLAS